MTAERTPPLAYLIAGIICLASALSLGYGAWRIFARRAAAPPSAATGNEPPASNTGTRIDGTTVTQTPQAATDTPHILEALPVTGGEVVLGGEDTERPVRRVFVEPFFVWETEVTNEQYAQFVRESGHPPPSVWKGGEFPPGTAKDPVTGVKWQDAADFCGWLGEKSGAPARLPTEAEWTRAARGDQHDSKYPWGKEWDARAASSGEARPRAVKSYPAGKSPFGAYDMAGNVWEWVADDDEEVIEDSETGRPRPIKGKVVKGGAAEEDKAMISAVSRGVFPSETADRWIGFRCVLQRGGGAR
ncbi:MAG TPA: SUMF1/EgtB/PvdO family nonheme iron enzyme [Pyrinomonadaceae bacterium]